MGWSFYRAKFLEAEGAGDYKLAEESLSDLMCKILAEKSQLNSSERLLAKRACLKNPVLTKRFWSHADLQASIDYVCREGHPDVVKMVLDDLPNRMCERPCDDFNIPRSLRGSYFPCHYGGTHFLHVNLAAWDKDEVLRMLLERRCDLSKHTRNNGTGGTGGHECMMVAAELGHTRVVKLLLDSRVELTENGFPKRRQPGAVAMANGHLSVARLLDDAKQNGGRLPCGDTPPREIVRTPSLPSLGGTRPSSSSLGDTRRREAPAKRVAVVPVPSDSDEWDALSSMLFVDDPSQLGTGRDVREPGKYNKLVLARAWRVIAPAREGIYNLQLQDVVQSLQSEVRQDGYKNMPDIRSRLDMLSSKLKLDYFWVERFLLHGTRAENVEKILNDGVNERYCQGAVGDGIYLAEDAAKIDQYVSAHSVDDPRCKDLSKLLFDLHGDKHPGRVFYCFACRCTLGMPIRSKNGLTQSDVPGQQVWATPTRRELAAIPWTASKSPHHSLIVESGPRAEGFKILRYREFVITHSNQVLPQYLIAFERHWVDCMPDLRSKRA